MQTHRQRQVPRWAHYVLIAIVVTLSAVLVMVLIGRPESIEMIIAITALINAVAILVNTLANLVLRMPS